MEHLIRGVLEGFVVIEYYATTVFCVCSTTFVYNIALRIQECTYVVFAWIRAVWLMIVHVVHVTNDIITPLHLACWRSRDPLITIEHHKHQTHTKSVIIMRVSDFSYYVEMLCGTDTSHIYFLYNNLIVHIVRPGWYIAKISLTQHLTYLAGLVDFDVFVCACGALHLKYIGL